MTIFTSQFDIELLCKSIDLPLEIHDFFIDLSTKFPQIFNTEVSIKLSKNASLPHLWLTYPDKGASFVFPLIGNINECYIFTNKLKQGLCLKDINLLKVDDIQLVRVMDSLVKVLDTYCN